MHEVHPPDHPVHSVRDFLLHLFTITVGLLIALGLENIAEYAHHRHQVHEANTNLRHEIEDNRRDLKEVLDAAPREQARYRSLLAFLQARADGKPATIKSVQLGMELATPQDASWQTANATGALSYMEYAQVQRYASAYQLQKKMDALQDVALQPVITLIGSVGNSDLADLTKEQAQEAARELRQVMAHIETIRELGVDLDKKYAEVLRGE